MEDVTSLPMRLIAKQIGNPGLVFTEFVSAMAIHHGALKTLKKMQIHPDERPLGIQIFGEGRQALVQVYFFLPDGDIVPCVYRLVNEENAWKIDAAHVQKRWPAGRRLGGMRS